MREVQNADLRILYLKLLAGDSTGRQRNRQEPKPVGGNVRNLLGVERAIDQRRLGCFNMSMW